MLRFRGLGVALLGVAALGLTAAGCGGGDDDDGAGGGSGAGSVGEPGGGGAETPFESGVAGEKPVDGLSAEEAQQLCTAYDSYLSARITPDFMKKYACNLQAALSVQASAECAAKVDACMQQPPGEAGSMFESGGVSCQADATARAGCSATVDEFGACALAMVDQALSLLGSVTCESILSASQGGTASPGAEGPALPEACKVIEQTCPGFLNGEGAGE